MTPYYSSDFIDRFRHKLAREPRLADYPQLKQNVLEICIDSVMTPQPSLQTEDRIQILDHFVHETMTLFNNRYYERAAEATCADSDIALNEARHYMREQYRLSACMLLFMQNVLEEENALSAALPPLNLAAKARKGWKFL